MSGCFYFVRYWAIFVLQLFVNQVILHFYISCLIIISFLSCSLVRNENIKRPGFYTLHVTRVASNFPELYQLNKINNTFEYCDPLDKWKQRHMFHSPHSNRRILVMAGMRTGSMSVVRLCICSASHLSNIFVWILTCWQKMFTC